MPNRVILLLMISFLSACGSIPPPVGEISGVNAPKKVLRSYRMESDFDDEGKLKHGVKPALHPINSLMDLNNFICFDPDSWAEVKIFMGRVGEKLKECK